MTSPLEAANPQPAWRPPLGNFHHIRDTTSGGFQAAWWHHRPWGAHRPYLQIEQGPLCFKIEAAGATEHRKIVDGWRAALNRAGDRLGLPRITKTRRFRAGTWMTVATCDDWLVSTGDRCLDYAASLANLRLAEARLEAALAEPNA